MKQRNYFPRYSLSTLMGVSVAASVLLAVFLSPYLKQPRPNYRVLTARYVGEDRGIGESRIEYSINFVGQDLYLTYFDFAPFVSLDYVIESRRSAIHDGRKYFATHLRPLHEFDAAHEVSPAMDQEFRQLDKYARASLASGENLTFEERLVRLGGHVDLVLPSDILPDFTVEKYQASRLQQQTGLLRP